MWCRWRPPTEAGERPSAGQDEIRLDHRRLHCAISLGVFILCSEFVGGFGDDALWRLPAGDQQRWRSGLLSLPVLRERWLSVPAALQRGFRHCHRPESHSPHLVVPLRPWAAPLSSFSASPSRFRLHSDGLPVHLPPPKWFSLSKSTGEWNKVTGPRGQPGVDTRQSSTWTPEAGVRPLS